MTSAYSEDPGLYRSVVRLSELYSALILEELCQGSPRRSQFLYHMRPQSTFVPTPFILAPSIRYPAPIRPDRCKRSNEQAAHSIAGSSFCPSYGLPIRPRALRDPSGHPYPDSPPKIVGMAFVGLQQVWGVNRGVDRALRGVSERIGNG